MKYQTVRIGLCDYAVIRLDGDKWSEPIMTSWSESKCNRVRDELNRAYSGPHTAQEHFRDYAFSEEI